MKIQSAKAGIGTGRAGLQAASGLFAKAGLFEKGVKSFDPNDLNPFLLFDSKTSMIGTLENPTLDLDPSKQDTLDVITATRAGTATYTDFNGLIASAPANTVRVDQTQGAELTPTKFQRVKYTDFSQLWSGGNATITDGQGFSGNNSKIITGTSASGFIDTSVTTEDGVTYTGSVYIRRLSGTGGIEFTAYSSASSDVTPVITDTIGTDFVRVSFQFLGKSGGGNVFFGIKIQQSGDSVEIAMPQVEEGTTASSFVANTTGSAKFITGPTFGSRSAMILVEPSATNLVTYSEDFSDSQWLKNAVGTGVAPVVTLNAAESPDGTQNATKVVFDSGSGTSTGDLSTLEDIFSATNGASYTQSIYLKGETGGEKILLRNAGSSAYTTITLTNDWARYEVTETSILSFGYFSIGLRQGLGGVVINSKITVYAYGAQLEAGSVATSLIRTAGTNVTRAADDLVISGSAFSDFFNASEGTFYAEVIDRIPSENAGYLTGQSLNQAFLYSNINLAVDSFDGANFQRVSGVVAKELFRAAATYNSTTKTISFNGTTLADGAHNGNWATTNILNIGWSGSSVPTYGQFNGHIKRLIYWPYHSDSL